MSFIAVLLSTPLCALRNVLHVGCPTCGLTRSFVHLVHGDLAQAFAMHPMGPGLVIELACLSGIVLHARVHERTPKIRTARWILLNVVLFLGLWGIRAATGTIPV